MWTNRTFSVHRVRVDLQPLNSHAHLHEPIQVCLDHEPARYFWQIHSFMFPFNLCTYTAPSSGSLGGVWTQSWRGWLSASSHSRLCAHSNNWAQWGEEGRRVGISSLVYAVIEMNAWYSPVQVQCSVTTQENFEFLFPRLNNVNIVSVCPETSKRSLLKPGDLNRFQSFTCQLL